MQADYFPLPEDSERYQALKWQWENRDKRCPYVFTDPESGDKFTHRNRFMKGLCKRAGVKPFGIKAFRKYGPSVLNDIHRVIQILSWFYILLEHLQFKLLNNSISGPGFSFRS